MSESNSAPAPAAAPIPDSGPASPPPNTQTPLTVSEAGRLLNQARRQAASGEGGGEGRPAAPPPPPPVQRPSERRPSANEMAAEAAKAAAEPPAAPAPPRDPGAGLTALERALGIPAADGAAPGVEGAPAAVGDAIEIDGRRLTAAQVKEALSKAGDYTQKTQELAQQRQALVAQQEALAAVLPYIQPELQRLHELVQGVGMPDPAMLETDPQGYLRQWAQYQQASQEQARLGNLGQLQQQAQQRAMEQAVAQANEKLAQEFPFWANPAERAAAQQQIVSWAVSEQGGFNRDELRMLSSPHHLKTMMKAMAFDRMSERAKTSAPAATLQAPARGAAPPPALSERLQQAQERFNARPDVRSGAALLAARRAQ